VAGGGLERTIVFTGLTRPQMFAGVTWSYFVGNAIVAAELFLIFKSFWVIGIALLLHIMGVVACLNEPRIFDLWIARVSKTPRIPNYRTWGCNSYRP
jgi:type IV secretion system protein VirB3